jgi:hypothetical protein
MQSTGLNIKLNGNHVLKQLTAFTFTIKTIQIFTAVKTSNIIRTHCWGLMKNTLWNKIKLCHRLREECAESATGCKMMLKKTARGASEFPLLTYYQEPNNQG